MTTTASPVSPLVVLTGNPNSGKTSLYNALTGARARVGNYPGITVEHRESSFRLSAEQQKKANLAVDTFDIYDLPGTYSLVPNADDEAVALRGMLGLLPKQRKPDVIVVAVDAGAIERGLYLVAQLRELSLPLVVAITMVDIAYSEGVRIDAERLSANLQIPVVLTSSRSKTGLDDLKNAVAAHIGKNVMPMAFADDFISLEEKLWLETAGQHAAQGLGLSDDVNTRMAWGLWLCALAVAEQAEEGAIADRLPAAKELLDKLSASPTPAGNLAHRATALRYQRIQGWLHGCIHHQPQNNNNDDKTKNQSNTKQSQQQTERERSRKIDAYLLHPVLGPAVFLTVFALLFQSLFAWADPLITLVEDIVGWAGPLLGGLVPENMPLLQSLLVDGVLAGVGNVIVFVPQIAILFLFLSFLEDSGYLARAAFLLDKLMSRVGLHGRAFVPLLSGFACAVPAIMATRTIEKKRDRLVAILVTPLISCSARLPVYGLMIAAVFSDVPPVFGVFSAGAVVMLSMYVLSIVAAVVMAAVFKRTILKSPVPPLVLELPPYRMPRLQDALIHVGTRIRTFLTEAGTVILACTIVLWGLFKFPQMPEPPTVEPAQVAQIAQPTEQQAGQDQKQDQKQDEKQDEKQADEERAHRQAQAQLEQSFAGRLGKTIEPVVAPLGFDWKIGVGLIASFAAREVFVSTMGLVYGLGDGADEENDSLRTAIQKDTTADGQPRYRPLTALSLLVFFVLAMQCMSTLAATKRETNSYRWMFFQLGYMTVLAYVSSLLVYQIGSALGF